jgi:small GTP-binding protein
MGDFEDDLEAEDLDTMMSGDITRTVKCLVIGNGHVGKSTYARRFCRGKYDGEYKKTIGCVFGERRGFKVRTYPFHKHPKGAPLGTVDMMVWDTAGQEEYRELNHKYYAGAGCVLLCFSTRDRLSLKNLTTWREKCLELCGKELPMCVVQTKVDAEASSPEDGDTVTPAEAKAAALAMGLKLFRISSKEDQGIDEPFEYVASMCLKKGGGNDDQHLQHISRHQAEVVEAKEIDVAMRNAGSSDEEEEQEEEEQEEQEEAAGWGQKGQPPENGSGAAVAREDHAPPTTGNNAVVAAAAATSAARKAVEAEELERQRSEFQRKREELQKGSDGGGCCTVS